MHFILMLALAFLGIRAVWPLGSKRVIAPLGVLTLQRQLLG